MFSYSCGYVMVRRYGKAQGQFALSRMHQLQGQATISSVAKLDIPAPEIKPKRTRKVKPSPTSDIEDVVFPVTKGGKPKKSSKQEIADSILEGGEGLVNKENYVSFIVYGEPVPLQRHRVLRSGISYNPSSKQQKVFLDLSRPFLPKTPFEGPLEVRLVFHFGRPLSHFKTGKNSHIPKQELEVWHSKKKGMFQYY